MGFIDRIKERAKANKKRSPCRESPKDRRTYEAVAQILKKRNRKHRFGLQRGRSKERQRRTETAAQLSLTCHLW